MLKKWQCRPLDIVKGQFIVLLADTPFPRRKFLVLASTADLAFGKSTVRGVQKESPGSSRACSLLPVHAVPSALSDFCVTGLLLEQMPKTVYVALNLSNG